MHTIYVFTSVRLRIGMLRRPAQTPIENLTHTPISYEVFIDTFADRYFLSHSFFCVCRRLSSRGGWSLVFLVDLHALQYDERFVWLC